MHIQNVQQVQHFGHFDHFGNFGNFRSFWSFGHFGHFFGFLDFFIFYIFSHQAKCNQNIDAAMLNFLQTIITLKQSLQSSTFVLRLESHHFHQLALPSSSSTSLCRGSRQKTS